MSDARSALGAVIFDLDGVLIDSESVALQTLCDTMAAAGVRRTVDDVRHLCGRHRSALRDYLVGCAGEELGTILADDAVAAIGRRIAAGDMRPFPAAHAAVSAVRAAGYRIAIASSSERARVTRELAGTTISELVDVIVTGEEVRHGKPHPEIFLTAARALAVAPEACVVVEDSLAGITAARRAGMRVVGIAQTFAADQLSGADVVLSDLSPLADVLRKGVAEAGRSQAIL